MKKSVLLQNIKLKMGKVGNHSSIQQARVYLVIHLVTKIYIMLNFELNDKSS